MTKNVRDFVSMFAANLIIPALTSFILLGFVLGKPWMKILGAGLLVAILVIGAAGGLLTSFMLA